MQSRQEHQPSFHGLNPKNNLVLYSIITALILVIVYILFPKNPPGTIVGEADDKQPAAQSGQIVEKKEVPQTSPPPLPLVMRRWSRGVQELEKPTAYAKN